MSRPLLSICIPTYKREYIIDILLQSIYSQGVDNDLFEVCITDNSTTDETKKLIEEKYLSIDNLHYKKVTCKGFLNSIEALKYGNGYFLKLHNDYSIFNKGSLERLIDGVKKHFVDKPLVFYTLRGNKPEEKFDNFDSFMRRINYLSTWSTSFAIWKDDFDKIYIRDGIECNYMYPHTSILFAEYYKEEYIIDDYSYFHNAEIKKKGGYNLLDNFVRIYLDMVKHDLVNPKHIKRKTYKTIELNILRFCASNYVNLRKNEGFTYTFDDKKKIIVQQCGKRGYLQFNIFVAVYSLLKIIKK